MANNPMAHSHFVASCEELPPSDPRDAAVKSLNAKCRELVELAHKLQATERDLEEAKNAERVNVNALTKCAVAFGGLEEKFYNLMGEIERDHRHYTQECGMRIFLSHTESGMPIRVHDKCKKSIWD